jgi:hypothetical protein
MASKRNMKCVIDIVLHQVGFRLPFLSQCGEFFVCGIRFRLQQIFITATLPGFCRHSHIMVSLSWWWATQFPNRRDNVIKAFVKVALTISVNLGFNGRGFTKGCSDLSFSQPANLCIAPINASVRALASSCGYVSR